MAFWPGDDEKDARQKEEQKQARLEREQLKKDREAQLAKLREERAKPKEPS